VVGFTINEQQLRAVYPSMQHGDKQLLTSSFIYKIGMPSWPLFPQSWPHPYSLSLPPLFFHAH